MKYFKVIILGCGASGAMCAVQAKESDLAVIDMGSKPVKKLMVTGNGRCNLTNLDTNGATHYNKDITNYLQRVSVEDTLKLFAGLGLEYYADEETRVYPISDTAKSVIDVLTNKLQKKKVSLFLEHKVLDISKTSDGFEVKTEQETFACKKLVIATGGNTLSLLENLGIASFQTMPSLCALKANVSRNLNGQKVSRVHVTALDKHGNQFSQKGEVLFREGGLSGIVMFNASSFFARNKSFEGEVVIDLLPELSHEQLFEKLMQRTLLDVPVNKFFEGMLANAVAYEVLNRCKLEEEKSSKLLTKKELLMFVNTMKYFNFSVSGYFENNQVFSGGISLENLDENLQSKTIKNLYFCGEVCDIDGLCGGYNLQWAWTSGAIVGRNL